jgi:hypothetical protein
MCLCDQDLGDDLALMESEEEWNHVYNEGGRGLEDQGKSERCRVAKAGEDSCKVFFRGGHPQGVEGESWHALGMV